MPRMITLLLTAFLVSGLGWQAASAADLGGYRHGGRGVGTHHAFGFWGEAFPFGYRWSRVKACTRYEPVDTAHGVRMEKVWVCGDRRWR